MDHLKEADARLEASGGGGGAAAAKWAWFAGRGGVEWFIE